LRDSEKSLLSKWLNIRGERYLEYGLGGSTVFALGHACTKIVSVETDAEWIKEAKKDSEIVSALAGGRLTIEYANIGPTKDWGFPSDARPSASWLEYFSVGWNFWVSSETSPSFIFIDGRFRVASAIYSCLMSNLNPNSARTFFAIHDFSDDRPHYNAILKFAEVVDSAETLYVMAPRELSDPRLALLDLPRYLLDPR
jgi:hypothetical protein